MFGTSLFRTYIIAPAIYFWCKPLSYTFLAFQQVLKQNLVLFEMLGCCEFYFVSNKQIRTHVRVLKMKIEERGGLTTWYVLQRNTMSNPYCFNMQLQELRNTSRNKWQCVTIYSCTPSQYHICVSWISKMLKERLTSSIWKLPCGEYILNIVVVLYIKEDVYFINRNLDLLI